MIGKARRSGTPRTPSYLVDEGLRFASHADDDFTSSVSHFQMRELLQVRRQLTRTRDGLSFTAPKRGKARVVRLTDMAIAALKAHREAQNEERARAGSLWEETSLVFNSTIGTPMDVGNLTYRSFRPLLKRTDLPRIRFHDLRHTCATLLLSKGTHPKIVQEMLGHANISMTMDTYTHVLPDMQEKAARAMDDALS